MMDFQTYQSLISKLRADGINHAVHETHTLDGKLLSSRECALWYNSPARGVDAQIVMVLERKFEASYYITQSVMASAKLVDGALVLQTDTDTLVIKFMRLKPYLI